MKHLFTVRSRPFMATRLLAAAALAASLPAVAQAGCKVGPIACYTDSPLARVLPTQVRLLPLSAASARGPFHHHEPPAFGIRVATGGGGLNLCLAPQAAHGGGMNVEYCAQLCSNKNMTLAGVEFGNEVNGRWRVLAGCLAAAGQATCHSPPRRQHRAPQH